MLALQAARLSRHVSRREIVQRASRSPFSKTQPHDVRASLCDKVKADPQARVIARPSRETCGYSSIYAANGQAVGAPAFTNTNSSGIAAARLFVERGRGDSRCLRRFPNGAPEDVDVHNPNLWRGAIMCSDGERAAFRQMCEVGLIDTLRTSSPRRRGFQLVGLHRECSRFKESRVAHRCGPRPSITCQKMHRRRDRPGNAERKRAFPITRRCGRS